MSILQALGTWILKLFLSGLFNKVMTKVEEDARRTKDAAILHAESTRDAAATEAAVAKRQAEEAHKASLPKPANDPFGVDEWNGGTK